MQKKKYELTSEIVLFFNFYFLISCVKNNETEFGHDTILNSFKMLESDLSIYLYYDTKIKKS